MILKLGKDVFYTQYECPENKNQIDVHCQFQCTENPVKQTEQNTHQGQGI